MMGNHFWLTDAQMAQLRRFFPKSHGKPRVDDRKVLSAIVFINRNGLRWCDAPAGHGLPKALYIPRRVSAAEPGLPQKRSLPSLAVSRWTAMP